MAYTADKIRSRRLGRLSTGLVTTALALGGLAAMTGAAGAAPGDPAQAVTNYATYPANQGVPAGCSGDDALLGVQFTNGGDPAPELSDLYPLKPGQVTMTWTGFKPGCEGVVVSLASYRLTDLAPSAANSAVMAEVQQLNPGWQYRAGGSNEPFTLSVEVPDSPYGCYRQFDAVIGFPLAQIGPGGSYYSNHLRVDDQTNMLVSFVENGRAEVCVEVLATTTTTAPTTTTTTAPTTTTTTAPPTTSTTQVEQTAPTPPAETQAAAAAAAPQAQVLGIQASRQAPAALPATGTNATPWLAGMSALLLTAGVALAGQGRRLARRSS